MTDASPETSAIKEILFGSLSGIAGKIIEYPFDTVKVRLQSQPAVAQYTSTIDCFRQTIVKDGYLGLYRGLSAPLLGAMFENATLFVSFSKAQDVVRWTQGLQRTQELTLPGIMLAGSLSGAITSFVLTPVELVKCQLQVQTAFGHGSIGEKHSRGLHTISRPAQQSILSLVSEIYVTKGLGGFWRGQLSTLFRESGGSCCWFSIYELTLRSLRPAGTLKKDNTESDMMLAGAAAGVGYNTLFFPFDTVKSRMQTNASDARFRGVIDEVWKRHGIRGFFKGWGITVLRAAPSNALIFWVYETLCRRFS